MPFLAGDKSRSSTSKGAQSKESATSGPWALREEVVYLIGSRRARCCFALGIAYNPQGCPHVHDHVLPGYTGTSNARNGRRARPRMSPQFRSGFRGSLLP